jgi:hypothetical protein
MANWEVRNKIGDDYPARVIEADSITLDENKTAAMFWNDSQATVEAIVVLTPSMTITKRK